MMLGVLGVVYLVYLVDLVGLLDLVGFPPKTALWQFLHHRACGKKC